MEKGNYTPQLGNLEHIYPLVFFMKEWFPSKIHKIDKKI